MLRSAVCRWYIRREAVVYCRSKGCISAASLIRTMLSSCSGRLRHNSACLPCKSGVHSSGELLRPNTMLGNRAAYEVGKSYKTYLAHRRCLLHHLAETSLVPILPLRVPRTATLSRVSKGSGLKRSARGCVLASSVVEVRAILLSP